MRAPERAETILPAWDIDGLNQVLLSTSRQHPSYFLIALGDIGLLVRFYGTEAGMFLQAITDGDSRVYGSDLVRSGNGYLPPSSVHALGDYSEYDAVLHSLWLLLRQSGLVEYEDIAVDDPDELLSQVTGVYDPVTIGTLSPEAILASTTLYVSFRPKLSSAVEIPSGCGLLVRIIRTSSYSCTFHSIGHAGGGNFPYLCGNDGAANGDYITLDNADGTALNQQMSGVLSGMGFTPTLSSDDHTVHNASVFYAVLSS